MANRYKSSDIVSWHGKNIFFDANVLIYLFWPTALSYWENAYASIFGALLKQKANLNVDFMVISEAVNRAIHIEYEKHLQKIILKRKI